MNATEILQELQQMGSEQTKKIFLRHGAREPFFGVKVGDMKNIVKRVKKDHALSMALYDSGNSDAMYLAGLIADEKKISKADLQHWADQAYWYMISEFTVAWVASESPYGWELGIGSRTNCNGRLGNLIQLVYHQARHCAGSGLPAPAARSGSRYRAPVAQPRPVYHERVCNSLWH